MSETIPLVVPPEGEVIDLFRSDSRWRDPSEEEAEGGILGYLGEVQILAAQYLEVD